MNTKYEIVNGVLGNADVSVTFASLYITIHRSFSSTSYKRYINCPDLIRLLKVAIKRSFF